MGDKLAKAFRWMQEKRRGGIVTPEYMGQERRQAMNGDGWWKAAGIVFAAGTIWAQARTFPALVDRVQVHETRLAVVEANLAEIRIGISRILDGMERHRK